MLKTITIKTSKRVDFINITSLINNEIIKLNIKSGIIVLFNPHTTAGLTINENADPDVVYDIIFYTNKLIPENDSYRHCEGNSDAHIKSSLFGTSLTLIIENSKLILGRWQNIYFCEFDGPRERQLFLKIIQG